MKLLALGGSGGMGQYAVRAALSYDFVDSVVIADRNEEAARAFAEACGPKATAAQIDVTDTARLIELMSESDIVMNTVGPYFRFGIPVLKAAIAAKRDYIDICDDWEPTLEMLDLDASARDAGIVAVIGVGASPGASNMLAVCAARELDTVTSLITGWDLDGASPEPPEPGAGPSAATIHGIEQLTGTIRNLRDGAFVDDSPIKKFRIDYPGSGQHSVWSIGHPEPVTLPRKYPSLETCVNVMSTGPATVPPGRSMSSRYGRRTRAAPRSRLSSRKPNARANGSSRSISASNSSILMRGICHLSPAALLIPRRAPGRQARVARSRASVRNKTCRKHEAGSNVRLPLESGCDQRGHARPACSHVWTAPCWQGVFRQ